MKITLRALFALRGSNNEAVHPTVFGLSEKNTYPMMLKILLKSPDSMYFK